MNSIGESRIPPVAPRNSDRDRVHQAFERAFGSSVAEDADFFALGGDSLRALQVVGWLRAFGFENAKMEMLWRAPGIPDLADLLRSGSKEHSPAAIFNGDTRADSPAGTPERAASAPERNFWLLHQTAKDSSLYNLVSAFLIEGEIPVERVRSAIDFVAARHAIYTTRFLERDGSIVAARNQAKVPLEISDLQAGGAVSLEFALREIRRMRHLPFDLAREGPLRVALLRIDQSRQVLVFVLHHIAGDGLSFEAFWQEFRRAYNGKLPIEETEDPGAQSYEACQTRIKRLATPERRAKELTYWTGELSANRAPVQFPAGYGLSADTIDPAAPTEVHHPLSTEIQKGLQTFSSEWHCSGNAIALAAYFLWLRNLTGLNDIAVGQPTSGRHTPDDFEVHGCCINMLPIRYRLDPGQDFKALATALQKKLLDAIEHSKALHFLDLVESISRPESETAAFFETTFQYRNFFARKGDLEGLSVTPIEAKCLGPQFPLMLEILVYAEEPVLSMTFDPARFGGEQVGRLIDQYQALLANALDHPDIPIGQLSPLDSEERQRLLDWGCPTTNYARDLTVPELFRKQVEQSPSAVALQTFERSITYAELDDRAERWADRLHARGIGHGDHVGLGFERSVELVVAMLAVLKIGAVYVPLDLEYPASRLSFMIEDADLACIVTTTAFYGRLLSEHAPTFTCEDLEQGDSRGRPSNLHCAPESAAYLMYTSGSTGTPKGSLIPHRAIVRLVNGTDYARLGPEETHLLLASPSFDAATFEIWGALLNGARLAVLQTQAPSIADIREALEKFHVTTLWLTAGLFHLFVDEDLDAFTGLHQLLAGGDVLSLERVRKVKRTFPALRLINGYGPTENTTFSCCHTILDDLSGISTVPIGKCIANSEAFILNRDLQLLPVGVVGDLYVGGDGLSLGYWKRPELNDTAFVPHPFRNEPGAKLYRTGDLARHLPDGSIEFFGRKDHQVKIRGFRVELGEIEDALRGIDLVQQCAVIAVPSETGHRLRAYIVGPDLDAASLPAIQHEARRRLPSYLFPHSWQVLDSLPLTTNGKLDRKALPEPPATQELGPLHRPQTPTEEVLHRIWARLFRQNEICCLANFVDLGGDSLLAMRMNGEIRRIMGKEYPINLLLQHPNIRDLGQFIDASEERLATERIVPLRPQGEGPPLVLVHGLAGGVFWFLDFVRLLDTPIPVYGIQPIEDDEAAETLEELVSRYVDEILQKWGNQRIRLCGYSIGGIIAYEVARQLSRRGHPPMELLVFDSHPPNLPFMVSLQMKATYLRRRFAYHLRSWKAQPGKLRFWSDRWRAFQHHLGMQRRAQLSADESDLAAQLSDPFEERVSRYVPTPSEVPVTLVVAKDSCFNLPCAWRHLVGPKLEVVEASGTHLDLFRGTNLNQLAQTISVRLSIESQAETTGNAINPA